MVLDHEPMFDATRLEERLVHYAKPSCWPWISWAICCWKRTRRILFFNFTSLWTRFDAIYPLAKAVGA